MITFAIIDQYPIIRTGLSLFLKTQFDQIGIMDAENVEQLRRLGDQKPDIIILGITHEADAKNINLLKELRSLYPTAKLVVYDEMLPEISLKQKLYKVPSGKGVSYASSVIILEFLREGANGYLTKRNSQQELMTCINDLLEGKRYICNQALELMIDKFPLIPAKDVTKHKNLTGREYEIATYLLEGMSTSGIAERTGRKATTISTIKSSIFKKLEVDNIVTLRKIFCYINVLKAV